MAEAHRSAVAPGLHKANSCLHSSPSFISTLSLTSALLL